MFHRISFSTFFQIFFSNIILDFFCRQALGTVQMDIVAEARSLGVDSITANSGTKAPLLGMFRNIQFYQLKSVNYAAKLKSN